MSKSEVIQIRLTKDEKKYIQEIARKNKMNMSEFLLYGAMKIISESEFYNNQQLFSLIINNIQIKNSQWARLRL